MHTHYRGEAIYTAEVDVHFPQLSVGYTLSFAAQARAPKYIPGGVSRQAYAQHRRDVVMAMFGISHTVNTRVGNDFVRGVSGGERKRVTIAEAALSGAPLQCWDNSTRGLDSANALEFCRTLRMETDLMGSTAAVAIYQASQSAYDVSTSTVPLSWIARIRSFALGLRQSHCIVRRPPDLLWALQRSKAILHRHGLPLSRSPDDSRFPHFHD